MPEPISHAEMIAAVTRWTDRLEQWANVTDRSEETRAGHLAELEKMRAVLRLLKRTQPTDTQADLTERAREIADCPFCDGPCEAFFVTGMAFDFWCGCRSCVIYAKRRARDNLGSRDKERRAETIAAWNKRAFAQSEREAAAAEAIQREYDKPIPMVLFCPSCGVQHNDSANWENPPHKTHQCQGCGHLWRPAARYTEGVADIPLGTSDTRPPIRDRALASPPAPQED